MRREEEEGQGAKLHMFDDLMFEISKVCGKRRGYIQFFENLMLSPGFYGYAKNERDF